MWVQSLTSLSGLRIWCCCELWCRSQTRLGSHIAGGCGVGWRLQLQTSICCKCGPKKQKQKKKTSVYSYNLHKNSILLLLLFFCLFAISWAAPGAYGGSQARGLIGAVVASLRQSRSNAGSEPHMRPTPQFTAMPDP